MLDSLFARMAAKASGLDVADIDESKPKGVKSQGPQKFRTVTNGQIRRAGQRDAATRRRKATAKHRRDWFKSRRAVRVLEAQLAQHDAGKPGYEQILVDGYGSVDKAREVLGSLA